MNIRCPITDKVCYEDRQAAVDSADHLMREYEIPKLYIYRCTHCGDWHHTKSPQGDQIG